MSNLFCLISKIMINKFTPLVEGSLMHFSCRKTIESFNLFLSAKVRPCATKTRVTDDSRRSHASWHPFQNFLNANYPVCEAPVPSWQFTVTGIVEHWLEVICSAEVKELPEVVLHFSFMHFDVLDFVF